MASLVALAIRLVLAPAPSGPDAIAIAWHAPAECPSADQVRSRVVQLLGSRPPAAQSVAIEVRVEHEIDRGLFRADVRLHSGSGTSERRLTAKRCETLARAVALEIALILDLDATVVGLEARDEAPAAPDPAIPAPTPPTPKPVIPSPPRRPTAALRIAGGLSLATLPGASAEVQLAPAILWPQARLELVTRFAGPASRSIDAIDGGRIESTTIAAGVRGCYVAAQGRVEIPLCGAIEAGAIRAHAIAVTDARTIWDPWVGVVASSGVWVRAYRGLWVHLAVDGVADLLRPAYAIEGLGQVFRVAPAGVRVVAGPELRLPWP